MPSWICKIPFLKSSHYLLKFPNFGAISLVSFSTSIPKISIFDYLVNHHNFSPESASKVSSLSSANFIIKPQNTDSVLEFLKETGLSKNQIEALVQKGPWVLSTDLERTIKPKIKVFQDLGFQSTDLADIISSCPWLLNTSADKLRLSVLSLKSVLGPSADICRLLKKSSVRWFLGGDLDRTLIPNVECLKSCGIFSLQIAPYVCRYPLMFLTNQEKFKGLVKRVDEMGVERKSKRFLEAVRVISSMSRENWELKLQLFRDLGFSDKSILFAFRSCPAAFATSERKIKEVTELLLTVDDFSISDIVYNPSVLGYSVEKRLKPRLRVLKALQGKNLLQKRPAFSTFFQITDAIFTKKYLIPYSDELGDLCVASQGS